MGPLDELAILIEAWIARKQIHNLPLLAKRSGVSYPTVRRVAQREGNSHLNTILNILAIVAEPEQKNAFVQKHYSVFSESMETSSIHPAPLVELADLERFTLYDFLIIGLSATLTGTSKEEVAEKAGTLGLRALYTLHELGVIDKQGDRYVAKSRSIRINEPDNVLKSIAYMCEIFDFDRIDSRGSLYRLKTQGLTKEGVLTVYKVLYEASEKIQTIIDNESNHGEYVLSIGMVSTFLSFPKGESNL